MTRRRVIPFLAFIAAVSIVLFFYSSIDSREAWRGLPQHVGLGEHIGGNSATPPNTGSGGPSTSALAKDPDYANWNPRPNFKKGSPMPSGHNYTSTLVIAKTKDENIDWIDEKMPHQDKAVYVADDPTAPLHPPKNKGHEVMIYLSWIIDNYDNLPDVAMFMHAHQLTWHNDDLLGNDAHLLITRLSRQRVWREGFVNMRCSWHPGCPDWMHPGETEKNDFKQEEILIAKSWSELFPLDEVPSVLAQPCCAQFALSRERIQAKPYAQYVWYRDWLFNTQLPDYLSGRIWEYVWQFVFTGENIYCPKEHICFCDQFGTCFGGEEQYSDFIVLKNELGDRERDLREWEEKKKARQEAEENGEHDKLELLEKPEEGKDEEYRKEIDRLRPIVDQLKYDAEIRGQDPKARALEAGRKWQEGDDF
ncbi:Nn.00g035180.m01.CDS01 [Neocucurbitaria sp. VM-36]